MVLKDHPIPQDDFNQPLESSKAENWTGTLHFLSLAVKQKAKVEGASLGCLAPCPGLLPGSQHPVINGIPRLGMPLNAPPLLPVP